MAVGCRRRPMDLGLLIQYHVMSGNWHMVWDSKLSTKTARWKCKSCLSVRVWWHIRWWLRVLGVYLLFWWYSILFNPDGLLSCVYTAGMSCVQALVVAFESCWFHAFMPCWSKQENAVHQDYIWTTGSFRSSPNVVKYGHDSTKACAQSQASRAKLIHLVSAYKAIQESF